MSPSAPASATALVTGASRGLGRGIAEALSRDGLDVAIHYGSNRAAAEETEAACRKAATRPGQKFVLVAGDIAKTDDRRRIVEATEASFDELIAVNLKGPYFLSQLVARHWLAHRGAAQLAGGYKLVFVSSASAARVSVNRGEYCVSKAGLAMASKLWAVRLAGEGIQVYELRPGVMATDMTAAVKDKYDKMIADGLIPQGRWGTAEDVGRAVSALLKGSLPFSTGEVINIDGGLHLERL
jgi:NAD(P)-dependent dehydrogenase (short-subunit alcohol dehydrogenase family)